MVRDAVVDWKSQRDHSEFGVIPKPREQHPSIVKIDNLDLSLVKDKLCLPVEKGGKGWTSERFVQAQQHYRMFLLVSFYFPEEGLVPTEEVDEVWHTHILFMRKYEQDCVAIFGRILYHEPTNESQESQNLMKRN